MTGAGNDPRTMSQLLKVTDKRLIALERRQYGKGSTTPPFVLPDRLGATGQQVTDWNTAIAPGWYWGNGAANQPVNGVADGWWVGETTATLTSGSNVILRQELSRPNRADQAKWVRNSNDGGATWSVWMTALDLSSTYDLNKVTHTGQFIQRSSANATGARNYPEAVAGFLDVIGNDNQPVGVGVHQRYTTYGFGAGAGAGGGARTYERFQYQGTWSSWTMVSGRDANWTDLSSYLASGMSYAADPDATLAGIRATRVGPNVMLSLGNFVVASMSVGVTGNVVNANILTAIPARFRPLGGAGTTAGWNGRSWSGFVSPAGDVVFAAVTPSADMTGTETWTNQQYSGTAYYPAATP